MTRSRNKAIKYDKLTLLNNVAHKTRLLPILLLPGQPQKDKRLLRGTLKVSQLLGNSSPLQWDRRIAVVIFCIPKEEEDTSRSSHNFY